VRNTVVPEKICVRSTFPRCIGSFRSKLESQLTTDSTEHGSIALDAAVPSSIVVNDGSSRNDSSIAFDIATLWA
jgi:hypothetical protein